MSIVPIPAALSPPTCLSLYLWSHSKFPLISWQRKRRLRTGLQVVLHFMQAPPKSGWKIDDKEI